MKYYARVVAGKVVEIVAPMVDGEGEEIPIQQRFHPDIVTTLFDINGNQNIKVGWTYESGTFSAPVPPTLSPEQIRKVYEDAAQEMLDEFALAWGYDSLERAASYRGDPNPKYDAEGTALFNWRSAVWTTSEGIDESVKNGGTPPVDVEAYLAMLPAPPSKPSA